MQWISPNCTYHSARPDNLEIIRIDPSDTLKIAAPLSNDAVCEAGVAAGTCNLNNTDRDRLLYDPRETLKNLILQL